MNLNYSSDEWDSIRMKIQAKHGNMLHPSSTHIPDQAGQWLWWRSLTVWNNVQICCCKYPFSLLRPDLYLIVFYYGGEPGSLLTFIVQSGGLWEVSGEWNRAEVLGRPSVDEQKASSISQQISHDPAKSPVWIDISCFGFKCKRT